MISIREETKEDYDWVRRIISEAFEGSEFGHNGESELVDTLRARCEKLLSLVACTGSEVVGHVLFTPVVVRRPSIELEGMGLAPLSVTPAHQRCGIGASLVADGLQRLRTHGCPFVVVLGHPLYYVRFGFRPALQFKITHGFAGIAQDAFFIHSNDESTLNLIRGNRAYYHSAFGPQHHFDSPETLDTL